MVNTSLAFKINLKRPCRKVGGLASQMFSVSQILVGMETPEITQHQK